MQATVWRNEAARARLEAWYNRFLERIEVPVESRVIDTSFGPGHVLLAGSPGATPLVCLHAMRTSSAHLLSELHPLGLRFRLIAPDLPGQSIRGPQSRISLTDHSLADWLVQVLDQLEVEQPHLLGVSWGGFVARKAASSYPDRFSRLVLIVPAGIVNGSHWRGLAQMAMPMLRYRLRPSEERLRAVLQPLLTTWDEQWTAYLGESMSDMKLDPRIPPLARDEELSSLQTRTLVLGGDEDISFPGRAMVDRVLALMPQVDAELLEGCRHCPPTTPEFRSWLAHRVSEFLEPSNHRQGTINSHDHDPAIPTSFDPPAGASFSRG
jgi:2-hydroxy-6-oxonona-2,4-dienedioate hydrolase